MAAAGLTEVMGAGIDQMESAAYSRTNLTSSSR